MKAEKSAQFLSHFEDEQLIKILDAMKNTQTNQFRYDFLSMLERFINQELERAIMTPPNIDPVRTTNEIFHCLPEKRKSNLSKKVQ